MVSPALLERIGNREVESCQIQLESPLLHIGSAEGELNAFEFVQNGSHIYLPNQEALALLLQKRGQLNNFVGLIEDQNERENLTHFLDNVFGDDWRKLKTHENVSVFPKTGRILKWADGFNRLRPMIRNGIGQLYIPGSSIKGAIRTAIVYHLIQNAEQEQLPERFHKRRIIELINTEINDIRSSAKFADDKRLINPLLANFKLEGVDRKIEDSNRDFMRLIHVSDSAPLVENQYPDSKTGQKRFKNLAVVPEILIISHYQDWNPKHKGSIYPEMVRNVKTEFTLSLDHKLLKKFKAQGVPIPFQNITDILQICREFAQAQRRHEENHWQNIRDKLNAQDSDGKSIRFDFSSVRKFYQSEANSFNLRLGWGCGFTGTSIGLALDDETRQLIRENCMPKKANGFESPKTRRIAAITTKTSNREIRFVPGWIKLKVLSSSK